MDKRGKHTEIDELLDSVDSVGGIDAKILLIEAYETAYEIFDHENVDFNRPLSLVAMHEKECYGEVSGLRRRVERYNLHDIYNKFGLSLSEFLDLPRDYTEMLFSVVQEQAEREGPSLGKQVDKLERDFNKGGIR